MLVETRQPRITKEVPGPKARSLIEADRRVTSPSLPRDYPLVADYAQGCMVIDVDGNRFLDFAVGIAVTATGHCHPRVVTEEALSQMIPSSSPTLQSC